MDELPLEQILDAGDSNLQFRKLYEHYSPFVWRVIFRTVRGNSPLAEEVLQRVFTNVHRTLSRKRGGFTGKSSFSTWLYSIAFNESLHILKREKRFHTHHALQNEFEVIHNDDMSSITEQVNTVLAHLTADERFLLVSREIDGFSFDELAVITGKKSGALRTMISRIKQKVREAYYEK